MSRAVRFLITLGLVAIVAGCWIPEKFTARVVVNKDGGHSFKYDGTLTLAIALAAAKEGKLSPKDEAGFKKEEEKIRKDPGFKKVNYVGSGRYEVLYEQDRKAGEATYFLSKKDAIFSVVPKQDGTIEISGFKVTEKNLAEFNKIGAKVDGYLKVSLGKGMEVVKHNAQSTPKLFGLYGDYEWNIKSPDATPFIVVRPTK